jgi:hypothetical protein
MTALVLTVLTGCDSTQQQAARARLKAARFIVSHAPTIVRRENDSVRVVGVTLLHGLRGTAIAVRLRNTARHPLNDLPISVGVVALGGRRTYLNSTANTDYFETHLASIPGGGSLTWVFTTTRRLTIAATAFATVGARASVPARRIRALPRIDVATAGSRAGGAAVRVRVTNTSSVPQYQLQVYALGRRRGRYIAAARTSVGHLDAHRTETLALPLVGGRRVTSVELEVLPTTFQ